MRWHPRTGLRCERFFFLSATKIASNSEGKTGRDGERSLTLCVNWCFSLTDCLSFTGIRVRPLLLVIISGPGCWFFETVIVRGHSGSVGLHMSVLPCAHCWTALRLRIVLWEREKWFPDCRKESWMMTHAERREKERRTNQSPTVSASVSLVCFFPLVHYHHSLQLHGGVSVRFCNCFAGDHRLSFGSTQLFSPSFHRQDSAAASSQLSISFTPTYYNNNIQDGQERRKRYVIRWQCKMFTFLDGWKLSGKGRGQDRDRNRRFFIFQWIGSSWLFSPRKPVVLDKSCFHGCSWSIKKQFHGRTSSCRIESHAAW